MRPRIRAEWGLLSSAVIHRLDTGTFLGTLEPFGSYYEHAINQDDSRESSIAISKGFFFKFLIEIEEVVVISNSQMVGE